MASENEFLLHAFFMGAYITFVYDILRIIRRVIPHGRFWVSVEDIVFWIYCAAEVFLLMYYESNGTLRWFAVFGALVGMLLYKKTLGILFVKYISMWLQKLKDFVVKIGRIVLAPFLAAGRTTVNTANKARRWTVSRSGQAGRLIKKKLTFCIKVLKIK